MRARGEGRGNLGRTLRLCGEDGADGVGPTGQRERGDAEAAMAGADVWARVANGEEASAQWRWASAGVRGGERALGRGGGVARLRAEGVTCGLGLPGERERGEEADRAGLGRAAGPAQKVGPRGGRWVWAGKLGWGFLFSFLFSISNSNKV